MDFRGFLRGIACFVKKLKMESGDYSPPARHSIDLCGADQRHEGEEDEEDEAGSIEGPAGFSGASDDDNW